jgi:hypothetical protein
MDQSGGEFLRAERACDTAHGARLAAGLIVYSGVCRSPAGEGDRGGGRSLSRNAALVDKLRSAGITAVAPFLGENTVCGFP